MKLPKGFGLGGDGGGMGGMMAKMQEAMQSAQNIESDLEAQTFHVDKGPVQGTFNGVGRMLSIKIDPSVIDPEDAEGLEALVAAVVSDGYEKATELRNDKVQGIMPNLPNIPGLTS